MPVPLSSPNSACKRNSIICSNYQSKDNLSLLPGCLSPHTYVHIHINVSNTHTHSVVQGTSRIIPLPPHRVLTLVFTTLWQGINLGHHWVFLPEEVDKKALYFICSGMKPFAHVQCLSQWCCHGSQILRFLNPLSLRQSKAIAFWNSEVFWRHTEERNADSITHFQFPTWFWKLFEHLSICNQKQSLVICNVLQSSPFDIRTQTQCIDRHSLTWKIKAKLVKNKIKRLWYYVIIYVFIFI